MTEPKAPGFFWQNDLMQPHQMLKLQMYQAIKMDLN